jgi:hypothetical protein
MASIDRDYMLQTISDLSKDAYGFRVRLDYAPISDAELAETFDRYAADVEASIAREQIEAATNQANWEKHIYGLIAAGAGNRATAIRWDMAANNLEAHDVVFTATSPASPIQTRRRSTPSWGALDKIAVIYKLQPMPEIRRTDELTLGWESFAIASLNRRSKFEFAGSN